MTDADDLLATIAAVTETLTRQNVPYFLTGSLASSIHGALRATNDVDIVAALDPAVLASLIDDLSHAFIADIEQARNALRDGMSFNLLNRATYLKVDLFPCISALDRAALGRAEVITLPGTPTGIRVATREDILLAKLRWYRLGGEVSERQWHDVEQLVALNCGELDATYLHAWAARLGVDDLLMRLPDVP